jgi:SNF family Na+-dependent transporter
VITLEYSAMVLVFCLCVMVYVVHEVTAGINEGIEESVKIHPNV